MTGKAGSGRTTLRNDIFLDTDLVAFAPCGCWFAVMIEERDLEENGRRVAEFARDAKRSGSDDVRRMTHKEWIALSTDADGKPLPMCQHEPRWGGMKPTHRDCPACHKTLKLRQDGSLPAHKAYGSRYAQCSMEARPSLRTEPVPVVSGSSAWPADFISDYSQADYDLDNGPQS
jgi:hypothetical protein